MIFTACGLGRKKKKKPTVRLLIYDTLLQGEVEKHISMAKQRALAGFQHLAQ